MNYYNYIIVVNPQGHVVSLSVRLGFLDCVLTFFGSNFTLKIEVEKGDIHKYISVD